MNWNFYKATLFTVLFLNSILAISQENFRTVGNLPASISETSGLLYFNNALITHNDSGNQAILYELDTLSLSIQRTITIANLENVDWEALAQDEDFIYIGDFGNNSGTRRDLAIYKVSKSDYLTSDSVNATVINFSYEDQTNFDNNGDSDWDAEAFFVLNDELIILTKQWQSQGTVAYSIPKESGTYVASSISSFDNIGLVTDATYNTSTSTLVILGYSNFLSPFIASVKNLNPQAIFEGMTIQNLGLNFVQTEGVTFVSDTTYYITSEQFIRTTPSINSPSQLFSFELKPTDEPIEPVEPEEPVDPNIPIEPNPQDGKEQLIVYHDNAANLLRFKVKTNKEILGQVIFDMTGRMVWKSLSQPNKEGEFVITLETGLYYFVIYTEDGFLTKAFVPIN